MENVSEKFGANETVLISLMNKDSMNLLRTLR